MTQHILWPIVSLVALTAAVWAVALQRRVAEIRQRRLPLQSLASAHGVASTLQDSRAMDNFNNLMQLPVLFYLLCLSLAVTGGADSGFVAGAWLYVVLRGLHSLVQVTYNRVMHRFVLWLLSSLVLFGLWSVLAFRLATSPI